MRDIIVHVRNYHSWGHSAAYAADLAAQLDGSLTGVYIEATPAPAAEAFATAYQMAMDDEEQAARAVLPFSHWAASMGVTRARWQVAEGDLPRVLARLACWHDVLVMDRDGLNPLTSTAQLGSIILSCEIPCIVVPPHRRQAALEHIAVAWNGSSQAIRALHAARPLLMRAKEITVLEGPPPNDTIESHWTPRFDIGQYLLAHGLTAQREPITGNSTDAGDRLLETAHRCHADLLVMGAYGRSRLREWMLGGTTRSVLMDATVPVLFRH